MEKLEKHIKEALDERRISPSADAWNKVSSQIKTEERSPRNKRIFYAVAASFIGVLLVSLLFFQSEEPSSSPQQLVNEDVDRKDEQLKADSSIQEEIKTTETEVAEMDMEKQIEKIHTPVEAAIADTEHLTTELPQKELKDSFVVDSTEMLIAQKINEVAAQVALLETINEEVSNAEVDSLLRAAQQQILSERIFISDKVDAMALLTEVEDELDESFRDQIFDALKDGYFRLRTAVADRNN